MYFGFFCIIYQLYDYLVKGYFFDFSFLSDGGVSVEKLLDF